MGAADSTVSTPPTLQCEEMFVKYLRSDPKLLDLPIVAASNRDALVPPLHCYVLCRCATPVMNWGQNYRSDVIIMVASNIDDNDHRDRKRWLTLVLQRLTHREPPFVTLGGVLLGWPILNISEVSEGQQAGDMISLAPAFSLAG
jgi:hypothetical protein